MFIVPNGGFQDKVVHISIRSAVREVNLFRAHIQSSQVIALRGLDLQRRRVGSYVGRHIGHDTLRRLTQL